MSSWSWFLAGAVAGTLATLAASALWPRAAGSVSRWPMGYSMTLGLVVVFALSALFLYSAVGTHTASQGAPTRAPGAHPGTGTPNGNRAQSMEVATEALRARLEQHGGTAADWQLLAQSYDFLGRPKDAEAARAHVTKAEETPWPDTQTVAALDSASSPAQAPKPAADAAAAEPEVSIAALKQQVEKNPRDAHGWLALATYYRQQRNNAAARTAYERVILLRGMDSQAWADYADFLGVTNGGSLGADAATAIKNALALDASNPKALWLEATQALQQKRYADAQVIWKRLKTILPPESQDVRLVDANIAEADQLAGRAARKDGSTTTAPAVSTGATAAVVTGVVSVDSSLAARVQPDATLFIYAKAADSPGAPLAVVRMTSPTWPVSFRLDDSMAMLPTRKLSQFQRVIIEARISHNGQAMPGSKDLYVTSEILNPSSGPKLTLVINREIG